MNLIPFDLERALAGDKVVTRNGINVIEIKFFENKKLMKPVVFSVDDEYLYFSCTKEGKFHITGYESPQDLFMSPKTKVMYVYVMKDKETSLITSFTTADNLRQESYFYEILKIFELKVDV